MGPKGATIKRIQQQTSTYIVTPSRDKEPVFEVTGMPDNVEAARKDIEGHIAMRTGSAFEEEAILAAIANAQNLPLETVMSNPEIVNYVRLQQQQQVQQQQQQASSVQERSLPLSSVATSSASLNALLSSNTVNPFSSSGLGSSSMTSSYNGSGSLNTGASTGHLGSSGLSSNTLTNNGNSFSGHPFSLSNGLNSNYSSGLNSHLSSFSSALNGGSASNNGALNSFPNCNGSSLTAMLDLSNLNLGPLGSGLSSNAPSSTANGAPVDISLNLLGEMTNNLLNTKSPAIPLDSTNANIFSVARNSSDFPNSTGLPTMYGIDEGLGSLGSSMGSSPALEPSQNIWNTESKFSNPLGTGAFGSRNNFNYPYSGDNSPSHRLSPSIVNRSPLRRSNSDTQQYQILSTALSALSRDSAAAKDSTTPSTSPDMLADFNGAFVQTSTVDLETAFKPVSTGTEGPETSDSGTEVETVIVGTIGTETGDIVLGSAGSSGGSNGSASNDCNKSSANNSVRHNVVSPDSAAKAAEKLCSVCTQVNVEAVYVPCGHHNTCMKCATKMMEDKTACHSCKEEIREIIKLQE